MHLFSRPLLLAALSTITLASYGQDAAITVLPRPKPGREPRSWAAQKDAIPLFKKHPRLATKVGYAALGLLPTPLESAPTLAQQLQVETLLIKRDDLAGPLFGGNKVRKLEFLLGDATTKSADHIVTWGSPGSRHTTMTALYTNHLKLPCTCMYVPVPGLAASEENVAITQKNNAEQEIYRGNGEREIALHKHNKKHLQETGGSMYFIPEGGSDIIGALGLVNGVGELVTQCQGLEIPLPNTIYIASATAGSAAGLCAGLDLWGIQATVIVVAQAPNKYPREHEEKIEKLYACIMQYLSLLDARIPFLKTPKCAVLFAHGFTQESDTTLQAALPVATAFFKEQANYTLDPVFATRLWAAFLLDALDGSILQKRVMLWNTGEITV